MIKQEWKKFCDSYISDNGYWYIPKGLTIKEENIPIIKKRLKVLKEFEGQIWSKVQYKYVRELIKRNLFERRARKQTKPDKAAIARMFKVVVSTLGLAWVNENENIILTEVGNKLIKSKNYKDIIRNQIKKYQFYNLSFRRKKDFIDFQVIPIQFLCEVINRLKIKRITKEEYVLFIAKKKRQGQVYKASDEIERFRKLSKKQKIKLINYLDKFKIKFGNLRRTSIYNTINLESPYAMQFFGLSGILKYKDGTLSLDCTQNEMKKYLKKTQQENLWIEFKSLKDWFYYYGNIRYKTPIKFALDYYMDISDIDNGIKISEIALKRGFKLPVKDINKYKSVLVDEKILEDFLESHIQELETDLKLIGRQYSTISGPIDLLAKDKNNNYVIIELKKGRTADKVVGQVLRYVGSLAKALTSIRKIRAIIVGKKVTKNLLLAIEGVKIDCRLYEFDYRVKFNRIA
jgi:hypothetical protein